MSQFWIVHVHSVSFNQLKEKFKIFRGNVDEYIQVHFGLVEVYT